MKAIIKKDLASYFHTFTGWLFLAVLWAFLSFFVSNYNFLSLSDKLANSLSTLEIAFLIMMPILTMRSFSEEQKTKTDQILFTAPVSVGQVVLGKFCALGIIYTILTAMTCVFPIIFSFFGNPPFGENYLAILGMWLFGLTCIAICVFISSLTENIVIAAVLSFIALFVVYMIPAIQNMISSSGNLLTQIIGGLNVSERYEAFLSGTLDLSAVIYLISVILLFLFLATQVIQKRRYSVSKKNFSLSAYSTVSIAVVAAIVIFANIAGSQLPASLKAIDMTGSGLYSLTSDTKELLDDLDQDVTIYVLIAEKNQDTMVGKTLDQISERSKHITITYIDPVENPTFLNDYTDSTSGIYQNSLIVVCGEKSRVINYVDLYEYEINYSTYSQELTGYDAEGQITSALAYVTTDTTAYVYTLTGHGEAELSSSFTDALNKMNLGVESLDFLQTDAVPDNAQAVFIVGPTSDLSTDDLAKLEAYAKKGGNLIVLTSIDASGEMTNFNTLLSDYGLSVSKDIVLDGDNYRYYQNPSYLLPEIETADITNDISSSGSGYVFAPYFQEITQDTDRSDVSFTTLLQTSESGYVRSSLQTSSDLQQKDGEETGVKIVGTKATRTFGTDDDANEATTEGTDAAWEAAAELMTEEVTEAVTEAADNSDEVEETTDSTIVLYSSEYIFTDNADQIVSGSNLTLFKGTISALTDTSVNTISVPVKSMNSSYLTMPTFLALLLSAVTVIIIPIVLLMLGLVIWLRRRKQ